uniref:Uncharacterized protein n=1 Tax=Oryza meridionalis TaxID=40149 RepID=A0A0E0BYM7_9ORYZ
MWAPTTTSSSSSWPPAWCATFTPLAPSPPFPNFLAPNLKTDRFLRRGAAWVGGVAALNPKPSQP